MSSARQQRESTVSMLVVRGLVQAVEQAGSTRENFLERAGLQPAELERPETRIPRREVFRLCEMALEVTGDPALGLHWAERLSDRMFVPVSHLLAHCASLQQAFALLGQFYQLLADEIAYTVVERDDQVTIDCLPLDEASPHAQRFAHEMMVGGFWRLVRSFNPHAELAHAGFAHAAPPYAEEYARLFQDKHAFEQPVTQLVFDRTLLSAPSPQKDDDVREALQALAEQRLQRLQHRMPYAIRVRDFLVREGFPHRTDMQSVARSLDVSVRSLRRRLEEEGKPYDEVLSEALAIVAKNLLRDQRRTIQEVAYEMGYSDPSTFHRAFKRWTGSTPTAYRQALLKSDERE